MSYLNRIKTAAPNTPAANKSAEFVDATGLTHELNDTGVDNVLTNTARFNWIRNSGFWLAQRQNPTIATTYNATATRSITADGWGTWAENASLQYQRSDTSASPEVGLANRFYGNFTKITAAGKIGITQVLESRDSSALRGRTIRVQVWAKSLVAATQNFRLGLIAWANSPDSNVPSTANAFWNAAGGAGTDPTLGTVGLSYLTPKAGVTGDNGTINGNALDFVATSAWQRFGVVFDVPTNLNGVNLIPAIWSNAQVAATNGIALSQISVTDGFEIQAWSPKDQATEIARCQRFFSKSFDIDILPQQNFGILGAITRGHVSVAGATAGQPIPLRLPVQMLNTPTMTFFNPSAANAFVRNITAGTDATATAALGMQADGGTITFTGIAAWTVAQAVAVNWTADGEL